MPVHLARVPFSRNVTLLARLGGVAIIDDRGLTSGGASAIVTESRLDARDAEAAIALYEVELGIPATDALTPPTDRLIDMVSAAFPDLQGSPVAAR